MHAIVRLAVTEQLIVVVLRAAGATQTPAG